MSVVRAALLSASIASLSLFVVACPGSGEQPPPPTPAPSDGGGGTQPPPPGPSGTGGVGEAAEAAEAADTLELARRPFDNVAAIHARATLGDFRGFESHVSLCITPPQTTEAEIKVERSLFINDRATLDGADFSLRRTMSQLATQAVAANVGGATAETIFADLWDTQNASPGATTNVDHCDPNDTLNGFPQDCPRTAEGAQAQTTNVAAALDGYQAVGLVNRIDLASKDWLDCGEHRIIYHRKGAESIERNFMIFEAVLPNPRPGCASGCRPVMNFWKSLSTIDDAAQRANALAKFFYDGLPGFRPVVHIDHYAPKGFTSSYGGGASGQIRTNQFLQQPWILKEIKLALDCSVPSACKLVPTVVPVKVNPFGELWKDGSTNALAPAFQQQVLANVLNLAKNVDTFSYEVDNQFNDAESNSQNITGDDYRAFYATPSAGSFHTGLQGAANGTGLTDVQLVNRAAALSCAGCHQPSAFGLTANNSIGPNLKWPETRSSTETNGFSHIDGDAVNGKHTLSPALVNSFLPFRKKELVRRMNEKMCICKARFPRPKLPKLELLERSILGQPRPTRLPELDKVQEQLDAELVKDTGVPLLDLKAQPLVFRDVRAATDAKRAAVRNQAVLKLVAETPPRETVNGSFRVE
jgi:hypothetical protein